MINKIKKILFAQTTRDTIISFIGLGTIAVVGMLFSVITARSMGPATFGLFSSLNAVVTLLSSMGDFGISAALVNFIPKVENRRGILISVTFWFQIIVSAFIVLLLMLASVKSNLIIPGSTAPHFIIIGILTGMYVLQGFALGIFNAERKFIQASFIQGIDSVIKLTIVSGLFFSHNLNIEVALLANLVSCFISLIFGFAGELKNIRPIFPKTQLAEIFSFSKWIGLSRIFTVMISRVDVLLLNYMVGSFQAGIYAASSRIGLLFALLVSSIGSVTAPRFSSFVDKSDIKKYLYKVSIMVVGVSLFMILTIFIADPIVRIIFGSKYLPAIPVFQALTLAMIPFLLSVIPSQPLLYTFNQPKFFSTITIFQVVIIIVLDIILIPKYQAIGPTISMGVANTFLLVCTSWKLHELLNKA